MNGLPSEIERQINRYLPVTFEGLTFYPVTVEEYEVFMACAPALGFMQQSLPVAMLSIPLLTAFLHMEDAWAQAKHDEDNGDPNTKIAGALFSASVLALLLALRLGHGEPMNERMSRARLVFEGRKSSKLKALVLRGNAGEAIEITPAKFGRIRPLIAAQNGIEIHPLDANPELVEADRAVRMANAPDLEVSLTDKISFVCNATGKDENEVYNWPILKFNRRSASVERTLNFIVFGIGENSGMVKFKNGNPCPSPIFQRKHGSLGMIALDKFRRGAEQDIENVSKSIDKE